jgi:hypothetical protein
MRAIILQLYYIAFPGSKASQNFCRVWNVSYKYKKMCTVQLKFSHEKMLVAHKAIQKYIHVYASLLST